MIHKVISEVDMGDPVIVQEIPFIKGVDENLDALEERIHQLEWKIIVTGTEMAIKEIWDERDRDYHTKEQGWRKLNEANVNDM